MNRRRKISLLNTIPRNTVPPRITAREATAVIAAMIAAMTAVLTAGGAAIARILVAGGAVSVAVDAGVVVAISARVAAAIFLLLSTLRRKAESAVLTVAMTVAIDAIVEMIAGAVIRIVAATKIVVPVAILTIVVILRVPPKLLMSKFSFPANLSRNIATARSRKFLIP